jgi:hypothetical protein
VSGQNDSSIQSIRVKPASTGVAEIGGYRFNLNAPSSAGATATLVCNQADIG